MTLQQSMAAEQTDGGLVFGADEHRSCVQTKVAHRNLLISPSTIALAPDLVWGSVEIDLGGGHVLRDLDLHGHRLNTGGVACRPLIDHKTGVLRDPNSLLRNWATALGTSNVTIRYQYWTSDERQVREVEGDRLLLEWFGAQPGEDVRDILCWAIHAAARTGLRKIDLGGHEYRYRGTIELRDGIELINGRLKVVDGLAMEYKRVGFDQHHKLLRLGGIYSVIVLADDCRYAALRQVELDGNWQGNREPFEQPGLYSGVDNELVNTPAWTALAATNHGARQIPDGQTVVLEDFHAHGYGAGVILGHPKTRWHGRRVKVGNSLKNHLIYGCRGTWQDLTLHGFCFSAALIIYGDLITGLRYEDGAKLPYVAVNSVYLINHRGIDHRNGVVPLPQDTARQGLRVDGLHIDARGSDLVAVLGGLGRGISLRGLTLMGREDMAIRIAQEIGNGPSGLNVGWTIEDVLAIERGWPISLTADKLLWATNARLSGVSIVAERGIPLTTQGAAARGHLLAIHAGKRADPGFAWPQSMVIESVRDEVPRMFLFRLSHDPGAAGIDVVVRDSFFRLSTNTICQAPNGQGGLASLPDAPGLIRLAFERVTFEIDPALLYPQNRELFIACSTFRDCWALWNGARQPVGERWPTAVVRP